MLTLHKILYNIVWIAPSHGASLLANKSLHWTHACSHYTCSHYQFIKIFLLQMFFNGSLLITVAHLTCFWGLCNIVAGKRILLRSDVRKTFSLHFIAVSNCEAVRQPRRSWNQSLLCDWPLVLHSMSTIRSLIVKRVFWVYGVYSVEGKCLHTAVKSGTVI
jgi:hypothetical protein